MIEWLCSLPFKNVLFKKKKNVFFNEQIFNRLVKRLCGGYRNKIWSSVHGNWQKLRGKMCRYFSL